MGERRRAFYKMADPLNFTNRFGVVVQVINFYFQMLAERDELFVIAGELPKGCHCFSHKLHLMPIYGGLRRSADLDTEGNLCSSIY
jgi:hypothetical protein